MPPRASICSSRWSATGSGVVSAPGCSKSGPTMPSVPRLAARRPRCCQIWRVKTVTEVLPLVPVTATMRLRLRRVEARRHAREAAARVGVGDDARRAASARQARPGSSVSTATAPRATASSMKPRPSTRLPGSAANRKPGLTSRESAVRPRMSRIAAAESGVRGPCAPSMSSVSRNFPTLRGQ